MSQTHLAGAARVSRSTIQRAERGQPISDESMRSICAVLGIDVGSVAPAGASGIPDDEGVPAGPPRGGTDGQAHPRTSYDDDPVCPPAPAPRPTGLRTHAALAVPLLLGVAMFGVVWAARDWAVAGEVSASQSRQARIDRLAAAPELPVGRDAAVMACGTAVSVRDCIEAEDAAFAKAGDLWRSAARDARIECLPRGRHLPGVIQAVESCLKGKGI